MLTSHSTGGFAATNAPNGFDLDGSEKAGLRACYAELRVGMVLYALAHEKDLHYRPLQRRVGLPLSVYGTPADVQDRVGARCSLAGLKPLVPRLKKF